MFAIHEFACYRIDVRKQTRTHKDKGTAMLNVEMKKDDGVLRVMLEGRLNSASAKDFSKQIEPELEGSRRVELDFAKLDYISSAGLRILLAIQQYMESTGGDDVCVRNANDVVLETMEMTGFRGVINVE